jgi:hypothetical protein
MMKNWLKVAQWRRLTVCILVIILMAGNAGYAAAVSLSQIEGNGAYHARRSFGAGLYDSVSNKTFINYSGPQMDVYVKAYNHSTSSWEPAVKVADWNDSSTYAYHDYGTMVMLPDGKLGILIFNHSSAAYLLKAPNAHSMDGVWTKTQINADKTAYPMPAVVGNTVYLLYSKNDNQSYPYRTYRMTKSTDSGATWSTPVSIIDSGKTADKFNEVYSNGVYIHGDKIYMTWSMAGGPGGHNHSSRHLYVAYLNTADGNMYSASGTNLGAKVDNAELADCLVYDALPVTSSSDYGTRHPVQQADVAVADDGTVVVAFGEQENAGGQTVRFGKLVSGVWSYSTLQTGTRNYRDLAKTGPDDFEVLYLSNDYTQLVSTATANLGSTWSEQYNLAIPLAPSNADFPVYANFIENRQNIQAIIGAVNLAQRNTDYTGKWPIIAVDTLPPTGEPETLVNENFDSVEGEQIPPGWTFNNAGGTVSVAADPGSTDKSLRLYDTSTSTVVSASASFAPTATAVTTEFKIKFGNQSNLYVRVYGGATEAIRLRTNSGKLQVSNSGSYLTLKSYTANAWHNIKIVADPSIGQADIYMDGVLLQSGGAFHSAVGSLDKIQFITNSTASNMTMSVDNVIISR